MAIIHYVFCSRNTWKLGSTLNHIDIVQPIYFNVVCIITICSSGITFKLYICNHNN